nr:replication initiation protein [Hymenobacter sp. BT559]
MQYIPEYLGEVKQHWHVTFARQKKISVYSKRILARVIDQIREDDYQLRNFYQLHIAAILEGTDVDATTAYAKIKGALHELADVKWEFESIDHKEWYFRHLLDTTKEQRVGYKNGIITILLNPQLAPYLVKAAHDSRFPLYGYLNLKSWYSMRFFEMLAAWQDKGYWEVSVDDYRQYMDCWHEVDKRGQVVKDKLGKPVMRYPTTPLLIENTIEGALKELTDTDFEFAFIPVYETGRLTKGRKKIIRFRFELKKKNPLTAVPDAWLQDYATSDIIQQLRDWQIMDGNITRYAPVLRREGTLVLLQAWERKRRSRHPITDKTNYCNAAFIRAGKQALEDAKQRNSAEKVEAEMLIMQAFMRNKLKADSLS